MNPKIGTKITLSKKTFKMDRANGWSMIEGMPLNSPLNKTAIYCILEDERANWRGGEVRLLSYYKGFNDKQPLSDYGELCKAEEAPPLKYVVYCDRLYEVRNDIHLWEKICRTGEYEDLFGIWYAKAPFNRFYGTREPYYISLLRIYEIDYTFDKGIHLDVGDMINPDIIKDIYYDKLKDRELVGCSLDDDNFRRLKTRLEKAITGFRKYTIERRDTLL